LAEFNERNIFFQGDGGDVQFDVGVGGMAAFIFGSNLPIFWKICRYFNYGLALCMKIFQLWLYAYQTKARNPGIQ